MKKFEICVNHVNFKTLYLDDKIESWMIAEIIYGDLVGHMPDWHPSNDGGDVELDIDRTYDPDMNELNVITLVSDDGTTVTVAELEVLDE